MKKRNAIIAAVVTVVALAAVPLVYGQGMRHHAAAAGAGHDGGFGMLFGHLDRVKQALGLSDAQVEQLTAIAQDLHAQNAPYRDQLRGGMQQVAQSLLADPSNTAAAQAILDQQAAAHKAMQSNMLAAASKALSVLTPDQRTRVGEFLAMRAARAQNRWQNR